MGKTGTPFKTIIGIFVIISISILCFMIFIVIREEYKYKIKLNESFFRNINNIIEISRKAKSENIAEEIFALQIEKYIKDINSDKEYKELLRECSLRIFNICQ